MQLPVQIVFHQLDPWPGAESHLRERAAQLERFCPQIMSCRVVVEETQKHHRLGRPVAVRIDVRLPGHELTANRRHDTDFHVAAREAFEAMTRQLEDFQQRRRGEVKRHEPAPPRGLPGRPQAEIGVETEAEAGAGAEAPSGSGDAAPSAGSPR
jgi:ribosome-associated translation inhibitor RaiA